MMKMGNRVSSANNHRYGHDDDILCVMMEWKSKVWRNKTMEESWRMLGWMIGLVFELIVQVLEGATPSTHTREETILLLLLLLLLPD